MKKRSVLLKVVSIIMIVFSAIGVILAIFSVIGTFALAESGGMDLAAYAQEYYHCDTGMLYVMLFITCLSPVLELVTGIMGLTSQNKNAMWTICLIVIVICVMSAALSMIVSGITVTTIASNLVSFVLPILYLVGVRNCQ